MNNSKYLVALQFVLIIILLIINDSIMNHSSSTVVFSVGLFLGILTLFYNRFGNFNIRPDIKSDAKLITCGPYKYIRHPMYVSVILVMFAVVLTHIDFINLILFILLLLVLFAKAKKEERLWLDKHESYKKYMKHTKMFIPFVF